MDVTRREAASHKHAGEQGKPPREPAWGGGGFLRNHGDSFLPAHFRGMSRAVESDGGTVVSMVTLQEAPAGR